MSLSTRLVKLEHQRGKPLNELTDRQLRDIVINGLSADEKVLFEQLFKCVQDEKPLTPELELFDSWLTKQLNFPRSFFKMMVEVDAMV